MNRVVYLHGFASSPVSTKARFFAGRFAELEVPFDVPDLAAGDFEHLTISSQLRVVENACRGEAVTLMGSSMGGYLAALYAARHAEVSRVVLMAPAFCFARRWAEVFGNQKDGYLTLFHYGEGRECRLDLGIIKDAAQYEDYSDFRQPTLIFHGTEDEVVPMQLSETFAATHSNAKLMLLASGHELTDQLDAMWSAILEFLTISAENAELH
jgi:pimeloyl-ACP methyl ester carboxylesterase